MGRKPNPAILVYFERGQKLNDSSNRYQHECRSCGEKFPKGRTDRMVSHIGRCPTLSSSERNVAVVACRSQQQQVPNNVQLGDGQIQLFGSTMNLPIAPRNNWSGLETLAEASRQVEIGLGDNGDGSTFLKSGSIGRLSEPPGSERLHVHEQYTLDNPPVSYEQRAQGKKQYNEDTNHGERPYTPRQMVGSGSSSPNLAMQAEKSMQYMNSMVDPQLLDEDSISAAQNLSTKFIEPPLSDTAAPNENSFDNSTSNQHAGMWSAIQFAEPDQVEKPADNHETPQTTYTSLPIVPAQHEHEFSAEYPGSQTPQKPKVRGKFEANRRKEVQKVRKKGACVRCRMLKKPCSEWSPCDMCAKVDNARVWNIGCIRTKLAEEQEMFSSNLHVSLAYHETSRLKRLFVFRSSSENIDASQYPDKQIFASFMSMNGRRNPSEHIDPNLYADVNESTLSILDETKDDIPTKLEAYMKRISPTFFENEPSHFMRVTLMTASALAINDDLIGRTLDLWSMVRILVDHDLTWIMSERSEDQDEAGTGLPLAEADHRTSLITISLQMNAAAEKRADTMCKKVLSDLERRLVARQTGNAFETFLISLIVLNCVEKATWLYKSWDQESFSAKWPLDKSPSYYAAKSDGLTAMLHLMLTMRNVPPRTFVTEDGYLAVQHGPGKEFYEQLHLKHVDVLKAEANQNFSASNSNCYELRYCGRLLKPVPNPTSTST